MGFLGAMMGSGSGSGFQAQGTNILQPATLDQSLDAFHQVQSANKQNERLYEQLAGQGGAQNQSSVFNQLQGIANGTGPNLAGAQLANTTGANVANQAALMAGQRGASANAGLLARQAAMQGGNLQQQAAGQGAALQAQQQQQALQQLAGISGQQVGQQQQALQGINQGAQNLYGTNLGAINAQNNANVSMQNGINSANAGIAAGNQKSQSDLLGGALNGVAGAAMLLNHGGMVPHYADGGAVRPQSFAGNFFNSGQGAPQAAPQTSSISSGMAGLFNGLRHLASGSPAQPPVAPVLGASMNDYANLGTGAAANDYQQLPNAQPAAAQFLAPEVLAAPQMAMPAQNIAPGTMVAADGGKVPGKAQVKGDSLKNDKVPAVLSPGEIVIPRSVLQSPNPALAAAHFVEQEMAKHGKKMADGGVVEGGDSWADRWGKMAKGMRKADGGMIDPSDEESGMQEFAAPAEAPVPQMNGASGERSPEAPQFQSAVGPSVSEIPAPMQSRSPSSIDTLQSGFNKQKAGILGEANALSQQGKDEQAITSQAAKDLQAQQVSSQAQLKDLDGERQKLLADVQNSHIDPNHYMGSMSTGSKVSTAIGLILGGMGGGLTHQENPALKYLQSQIDNDIKAQTTDIGKKQNLLTANMQQFGNLKDALAMTRANMLDIASMKLKEAAAKAMDPTAKYRGMQEAGKLDILAGQTIAPLKIKQEVLANPGNDPTKLVPVLVPKEHQAKAFHEIEQAQNVSKNKEAILNAFDQSAKDLRFSEGGHPLYSTVATPPSIKTLNAFEDPLIHDEVGRVNEFEKKDLAGIRPQAWDSDETIATKRKAYERYLDQKSAAPISKGFGIDLNNFGSTANRSVPVGGNVQKMGGVQYQKVNGGWKKVG